MDSIITNAAEAEIASRERTSKRVSASPEPEHDAKRERRERTGGEQQDGARAGKPSALTIPIPDDVWATNISPYLDYRSILRCSEVCSQLLRRVVPAIRQIVIERPIEMHVIPARKFVGVEKVDILSFVDSATSTSTWERSPCVLCRETSERFVPFIGCFPSAKHVRICANDGFAATKTIFDGRSSNYLNLENCKTLGKYDIVHQLIVSVCAAYRTGAIPPTVKIHGLFGESELVGIQKHLHGHIELDHNETVSRICQYNSDDVVRRYTDQGLDPRLLALGPYNPNVPGCRFCHNICACLHPENVCALRSAKHRGEVFVVDEDYLNYGPHICLLPKEKVAAIVSRKGGKEAYMDMFKDLYSKDKMTLALSPIFGVKHFACDSNGTPNPRGRYYMSALAGEEILMVEMNILIEHHGVPPIDHSEQFIIESLFDDVCGEEILTKEKDKCFMGKSYFEAFSKLFGCTLNSKFFTLVDDENLFLDDFLENNKRKHYHKTVQEFTQEDMIKLRGLFGRTT